MKDKHNVILILVSLSELNSLFRRLIKFLISIVSSSLFPGVPTFFNYFTMEIHINWYKDSPCVFNFSFLPFDHSFVYRSSSWRFYMMVHQGFNSFSKCSSRFFSEELKFSSSCNPECNSFTHIFWGGIMSFLIISLRASCFTSYQDEVFKYTNLFFGVILGYISPKAFPKVCCYLWCL